MTQSQRELANSTAGIGAPSSSTYMVDRYRHLLDGQPSGPRNGSTPT